MTVWFASTARRELAAQLAWLQPLSPQAASDLLERVQHVLTLLDQGVADGRPAVLKSGRQVRRFVVPPLVIFYDRRGDEVAIRRIRHMSQRPVTSR